MPKQLDFYQQFLIKKKSEYLYIKKEVKALKIEVKALKIEIMKKQRALAFIQQIALQTQGQLEFQLSDMVSAGLNTVFDQAYDFVVKFETRRDKTECDLFFKKHDQLIDPLLFSGLGAADVAAFALRCASWSIAKKYRNVLLLDEPFKHLKGEKENRNVLALMKMLSDQLNLQIICINDERAPREDIIEFADKLFEVRQNNKGISKVKELK